MGVECAAGHLSLSDEVLQAISVLLYFTLPAFHTSFCRETSLTLPCLNAICSFKFKVDGFLFQKKEQITSESYFAVFVTHYSMLRILLYVSSNCF